MSEENLNNKIKQNQFFNGFNKIYRDIDTLSHRIFSQNNDEIITPENTSIDEEYEKNYSIIKNMKKSQTNTKKINKNIFINNKTRSKSTPNYILSKKNITKNSKTKIKNNYKLKIKNQLKNLFRLNFCKILKNELRSFFIQYINENDKFHKSNDINTISNDNISLTYSNSIDKINTKKIDEENKINDNFNNINNNKLFNGNDSNNKKSNGYIINKNKKNDFSNLFIKPKVSYINYVDDNSNEEFKNNKINDSIILNSKSNKKNNQNNSKNSCILVSFSKNNNVNSSMKSNSNNQFSFRDLLINKNSNEINKITNFKEIENNMEKENSNSIIFSDLISPSKKEKNINENINFTQKEKYNSYPLDENYNKQINDICNNSLPNLYYKNNDMKINNVLYSKENDHLIDISEDHINENKNIDLLGQHNNELSKTSNNDVINKTEEHKENLILNNQKENNDKIHKTNKEKNINNIIDNLELSQIKNNDINNIETTISFNNTTKQKSNYYLKYDIINKNNIFVLRFLSNDTSINSKFTAKIKLTSYFSIIEKINNNDNNNKILNNHETQLSIRSYNNFIKNLLDKTIKIKPNNDSQNLLDDETNKKMKNFDQLIKEYKKNVLNLLIEKHYIQSKNQKKDFISKNNKQLINKQKEIKKYYNELLNSIQNNNELLRMIMNILLNYKQISINDVKNAKRLYKTKHNENKNDKKIELEKETNKKIITIKNEKMIMAFWSIMITFSYILNYFYKNQKDFINI